MDTINKKVTYEQKITKVKDDIEKYFRLEAKKLYNDEKTIENVVKIRTAKLLADCCNHEVSVLLRYYKNPKVLNMVKSLMSTTMQDLISKLKLEDTQDSTESKK